jgi:integrase
MDGYAERQILTGSALQLMAHIYPRPGELRQARSNEFDLEKGSWVIPAERTKLRQAHIKPLPRQAVAILWRLHKITGPHGHVFPANGRTNRPLSENTMNAALRRMSITADEHSSHGFRATASTLLNAAARRSDVAPMVGERDNLKCVCGCRGVSSSIRIMPVEMWAGSRFRRERRAAAAGDALCS